MTEIKEIEREEEMEKLSKKESFEKTRDAVKINKWKSYRSARTNIIKDKYRGRTVPDNLDVIEPKLA